MSDEKEAGSIGVELRGVYDGIAVWLRPGGEVVNRFTGTPWEGSAMWRAIEAFIAEHHDKLVAEAPPLKEETE